jgi:transcriptional regulator with XRE-family HTH domain
MDYKKIGQRIRDEREKFNLSRERFAEILDLSTNYVGQIERGEKTSSLETFVSIADTLHVSLDYLIRGTVFPGKVETIALQKYINRCTKDEVQLVTDVVRAMLPHLKRKSRMK